MSELMYDVRIHCHSHWCAEIIFHIRTFCSHCWVEAATFAKEVTNKAENNKERLCNTKLLEYNKAHPFLMNEAQLSDAPVPTDTVSHTSYKNLIPCHPETKAWRPTCGKSQSLEASLVHQISNISPNNQNEAKLRRFPTSLSQPLTPALAKRNLLRGLRSTQNFFQLNRVWLFVDFISERKF